MTPGVHTLVLRGFEACISHFTKEVSLFDFVKTPGPNSPKGMAH